MGAWGSPLLQGGDAPSAPTAPCWDPQETSQQEEVVSHDSDEMEVAKEQALPPPEELEEAPVVHEETSMGQVQNCNQASAENLNVSFTYFSDWVVIESPAPKRSHQEEAAPNHSDEMEGVKEEAEVLHEMKEVHALEDGISVEQINTCNQASAQNESSSQRDPDGQLKGDSAIPPPKQAPSQEAQVSLLQKQACALSQQVACLLDENEQLKQQNREKDEEISRLKLMLKTAQGKSSTWFQWCRGPPVKQIIVVFRTSGKTGGCEQIFLEEVSTLLSKQSISLKVEKSTETSSKDLLLLVFCPIASRMGTDMDNALEELHGEQKAILVVMHLIPPDNTDTFLDVSRQGTHPALVRTVHTRYTLQAGFYPCEINQRAMASVADAIKDLSEDNLRGDSGIPPTSGLPDRDGCVSHKMSVKTPSPTVFHVQIRVAGKTDAAEKKFLKDIKKLLYIQSVSLKAKEFTETSKDPLLIFCPIASRMDIDIKNALEGISGLQKVLLVVMHYARKDITEIPIDPKQQVPHPALVQAVHTRYTLQEGFYPCEMNQRAMDDVADAIKKLTEDN